MKLNKKLSKGKVSVVVGTQKDDSDHLVSSKDISRNDTDLESKIDKILNELKEELKVELGISERGRHESKASKEKGLDHFLYESLSRSSQKT
jgi:hypothetical protein|tara:strand:+ start:175 stop:450 length:276 start_codon:yes stop_codon:yes gene_type:complete